MSALAQEQTISRVVGTLSDLDSLSRISDFPCDLVELRLDLFDSWEKGLEAGAKLHHLNIPTLATVRLQSEGGKWPKADRERTPILKGALEFAWGIDVELRSEIAAEASALARRHGKEC